MSTRGLSRRMTVMDIFGPTKNPGSGPAVTIRRAGSEDADALERLAWAAAASRAAVRSAIRRSYGTPARR